MGCIYWYDSVYIRIYYEIKVQPSHTPETLTNPDMHVHLLLTQFAFDEQLPSLHITVKECFLKIQLTLLRLANYHCRK